MTTIIGIILIIFLIIILIAFALPFIGVASIFGYIIKNSLTKKTPQFLANEKLEMESKVNDLKKSIISWHNRLATDITNNMDFSYQKSITCKLTGTVFGIDNEPIIAFQRIDRGIYTNSRILAASTDFKIYFEYSNNEIIVFYNDTYLGKIINNSDILNDRNIKIGSLTNRHNANSVDIVINFNKIGTININSDRKNYINNPLYTRPNAAQDFRRRMKNYRETPPTYSMVSSTNANSNEDQKWLVALTVFESIYYGFDFAS